MKPSRSTESANRRSPASGGSAHGPRTLDAKWLDPECWDGCQSLILKGQVNVLREKLAIIWADSNYIRVEWLRENGHEEAAKAIENIRKHSAPNAKRLAHADENL